MSKLSLWRTICLVCLFCVLAVIASPAQTFTTLVIFNGTDGANPYGTLVQGFNGNFYGTTTAEGAHAGGTVFEITPGGGLTTLYNFCSQMHCTDGADPTAGLIPATNGNLYGTTYGGCSTVFEITPGGKLTTLYRFCSQPNGDDGGGPVAGLVQATNGNFYGTTTAGGPHAAGTVFEITPGGKLTTLYRFCSQLNCTDGADPQAGLVQATNGSFYGTTVGGGAHNYGTVFEITPGGKLSTLHSFDTTDGASPLAGLVQAINGNLYGTTSGGGAHGDGTVFEITPGGKLTTLYNFCSNVDCTDGADPTAGLIQAINGNLYGTTYGGGAYGEGTVFEITPGGRLTTLHSFCSQTGCTNGAHPEAGLVQATNGSFYGTTFHGGSYDRGTVFSLGVGLGPFVETLPTSGKVGAAVIILGNNLTGATSVTFNGKAAKFKVVSSTEITTAVPSGATTGPVKVTTPIRTLISNVNFRVS